MTERFDVVIIGSGTGGGTVAYSLSKTGARILIVERGDFVPQEEENWDPAAVWGGERYRTSESWLDGDGEEFSPYTHYCVGGNSKFWGCVLYRLRQEDFGEVQHRGGVSPAWPIDYETLAPWYDRAEELYSVHGQLGTDPTEPPRKPFPHPPVEHQDRMAVIVEQLREQGLHPSPLPLGLLNPSPGGREDGDCILCRTCNSYPCKLRAKGDADVCAVSPALQRDTVTLWTNAYAERLVANGPGDRVAAAEILRDGEPVRVEAPLFVVSCGAVNSAALLLRSTSSAHPDGLANSSGLVGRRYMAHLPTMLSGFMPPRHETEFAKTVAINDFYFGGSEADYPLGQIQSQGRTDPEIVKAKAPEWIRDRPALMKLTDPVLSCWLSRSVEWLAMTEDLPDPNNRVSLDGDGRIRLHWKPRNRKAHTELVAVTKKLLHDVGVWCVKTHELGVENVTHQCGTAVFGTDPETSVLDPWCRSHDVENLFVVDASFFPSSAAVNPGLTIAAQALRAADQMKETDLS